MSRYLIVVDMQKDFVVGAIHSVALDPHQANHVQSVTGITDVVAARAANKMNFGIALIPEGLVEFIPEIKVLIAELNDLLAKEEAAFAAITEADEKIALEYLGERKTFAYSQNQRIQYCGKKGTGSKFFA